MLSLLKQLARTFSIGKIDIQALVSNHIAFENYVYTSVEDAVRELGTRQTDAELENKIAQYIKHDIPQQLTGMPKLIFHRQLLTPNYETLRFVSIADALGIEPLFFEYHDDKFVTENDWKYHLGALSFYWGKGKKGGEKITRLNIIDFNSSNGKKISEIRTLWGQSLVEFHHELFALRFKKFNFDTFDGSQWYIENGGKPKEYYKSFLALCIKNGILFENFILPNEEELRFTKDIFLPIFSEVTEKIGVKPLIVALEPTDIEGDKFWMCHPPETFDYVQKKLESVK